MNMKKEYIIPQTVIARVNGQDDFLKDMTIPLIGGSKGGFGMGAKERGGNFEDTEVDFWSTKSEEY